MKFANYYKLMHVCLLFGCVCGAPAAIAAEVDELNRLLHEFLAAADQKAAHRRFWADDLVYTSSNGTRTDKARILSGFVEEDSTDAPPVAYSGEDVDIRVYGNTAIIAFRLIGDPGDGSPALHYFNTGMFLKRGGVWQAVAWQATRIPGTQQADE